MIPICLHMNPFIATIFVGVFLFAIGPASAVPPRPVNALSVTMLPADETPQVLRKLVVAFGKNIDKVNSDANEKRTQLDRQLEDGFDKAIAKAQAAGDINTVLALEDAKDHFATLTTSAVPFVKNALEFREKKTMGIEMVRITDAMKAAKELNDELEKAKKAETIKGNFETAKLIAAHQEKLVAWSKTLRSSVQQPTSTATRTELPRPNAQPELAHQRTEPPKMILVYAANFNGTSIGFAKAGDVFKIQYLSGRWFAKYLEESPDAQHLTWQDHRCVLIRKDNPGFCIAVIPANTKQTPFSFTVEEDGEYALRAWDGMGDYRRDYFNNNKGSVRYSVQKIQPAKSPTGWNEARLSPERTSVDFDSNPEQQQSYSSTHVLTGTQSDQTVRLSKAGSPYTIAEQYLVPEGSELVVDAGVMLLFDKESSLYSDGRLSVNGSEREPVVCKGKALTPGFWNGIFVKNSESNLDWVQISGAKAGLTIAKGSPSIANSVFSQCVNGAWVTAKSSPSFTNSVFADNTEHGIGVVDQSRARLKQCTIVNNGKWGVYGRYYGSPALERSIVMRNREGGIGIWGYDPSVSASQCIISENRGMDMCNGSSTRWDFHENYWGVNTTRILQTKGDGTNLPNIRDGRDTNGSGIVDISNFLTAEPKDCGATIRTRSFR